MMRIIILAVLFVIGGASFAQGTIIELKPVIRDDATNKGLAGATIEVYKGGSLFATESASSNGKVPAIELPICIGCTYTIKIKKGGYVTKTAIMDAHSDYPEEMPPGIVVQKFEVSIFESVEGIDFSFLEREPMVEFAIDSYGVVEFDQQKIKVMLKKIEDLKKKMDKKKEEIEKAEKEKIKQEADFNAYVEAGDGAVKREEYEKAIGQYELALGIKPDHEPTKNKIDDARIKLDELEAKEQLDKDFSAKMVEAKAAYTKEELEKALDLYNEASSIKPSEKLPKDLIAEIEKKIAEQKKNEAAFDKLVAEGDGALSGENFDEAISKYEAALKLKQDAGVKTKLEDAKKKKTEKEGAAAAEKANQEKYDKLIAKADAEFDTEKFAEAKKNYTEALTVKPSEAKPTERIAAIDKILKDREAELAEKEKLEADYNQLIAEGKEKINQRSWKDAENKYKEALKLKPNDPTALSQIDLIKKELEKEAGEAKLNETYDAFMNEAKTLFDQKKLAEAKAKYNQALGVKPLEQAPKDKIAEIEGLLADADKAVKVEADYKNFMIEGDAANDRKEYVAAIDRYKKALDLKPGDSNAQSKIDAANKAIDTEKKLADEQKEFDALVASAKEAFNAKNYDKAKLDYTNALDIKDNSDIKTKIKEIDDLIAANQSEAETKAKYEAAIKEADALDRSNDYAAALEKYKAAFSIKDDAYPKGKIAELTEKIADNQATEEKEKEFNDLVSKADAAYAAEDYSKALATYKQAIKAKPDPAISLKIADLGVLLAEESQNAEKKEKYDRKIVEANLAFEDENWNGARSLYEEAGRILPAETYPDEQIAEIEKRMAAESVEQTERTYQKIVDKANEYFNSDKLDDAKTYYDRAIGIKPSDTYVKEQIEKIAEIKRERAAALTDEKQLNDKYNTFVKEGERAMDASNWSEALEKFNEALSLKPAEPYPTNKIAEIESKLGEAELAKQKQEEYDGHIAKADQLFGTQDYLEAIEAYNQALNVKSSESYPKGKITDAENFLKLESKDEAEELYQKVITTAEKNFAEENYDKALELFLRAKTMKPSDPKPQQRIDEINQIMLKNGEADKLEEKYTDFIKEADYRYEKGEWKTARESYTSAYNLFNRDYPERRIKECEDAMKATTSAEENKIYDKIIKTANKYFDKANYDKSKELYERALKIKPSDPYPKDRLKEIHGILNPAVAVKTNLNNYGDPNRSVDALSVDAMLADAEEQRKFISAQKANQQQIDAENANNLNDLDQTDYTYNTRENVIQIEEDVEIAGVAADQAQTVASDKVEVMQVDQDVVNRDREKWHENDIQIQNKFVTNIQIEVEESNEDNDLPREEYLLDVDAIRSEIILENTLYEVSQTNETFEQKDYVTKGEEDRIKNDLNMDIGRKNTEVLVEDQVILLINETNENIWDQDDVIMDVKTETETGIDERIIADLNRDNPRVEGESLIEDEIEYNIDVSSTREDKHYDVSIDQKKFTENLINEIEIENIGNDIPRERMEDFSEEQTLALIDVNEEIMLDQNNVLFKTDLFLDDEEITREKNRVEDDANREGYEKNVEIIKENKDDFLKDKSSENVDESYETVDYLEDNTNTRRGIDKDADENADDLIDNTSDAVEEMNEENSELADKSRVDLENSEDFVESLKDINIKKINEKTKNSLGNQFPEGVTEEIYTIDDADGLMVSYIVRRVVVRNEVGNVYERVQTKFGTTSYTCNGVGITEFEWQDQTEAADLVRN